MVLKLNPALTLGASYQGKTALKYMKTGAAAASMSATGGFTDSGRMTVVDFQWPAMTAVGASWQASPALLVAADIKNITWADVMKDFRQRYDSATMGGSVSFTLPQSWKDQTVLNLGLAWRSSPALTLRAGLNLAANPIPDAEVNPLFPATVGKHLMAGLGYRFTPQSEFNASLTVTPTSTVTNAQGVSISHRQTNLQAIYSLMF
jgi:long-chain fatty acid transport protein